MSPRLATAARHVAAMGGNAHVVVVDGRPDALDWAAARLAQLEARWSRFSSTSEVSLLNANGGTAVTVSGDTLRLVDAACAGWHATNGAFDPTTLDALVALGYDRSFERVRRSVQPPSGSMAAPGPPRASVGCAGIVLDRSTSTIMLPAGCRFDPGGIGKGLAADIVATELVAAGTAAGACINVGGDVRVCGRPPSDEGWLVGIDDPYRPGELLAGLVIDDGGVASSSRLVRTWGPDRHHLVDPATGLPVASPIAAVSVVALDAATAEVLTKAAFVLGEGARTYVNAAAAGALVIADDGSTTRMGSWPAWQGT